MKRPDLLEDPTGFPDAGTVEVDRRPKPPEPPGPPLDARRIALLGVVLVALLAGSLLFL